MNEILNMDILLTGMMGLLRLTNPTWIKFGVDGSAFRLCQMNFAQSVRLIHPTDADFGE